MTRKPSLTIDQIEQLEKKGGQAPELFAEEAKKDKREEPKEFLFERHPDSLWSVKLSAGGRLPDVLSGRWTSLKKAEEAVACYIEQRDAKAAG